MQRINIVGSTGAGKSTFAKQLAYKLGHPCIALDELFWGANWTPRPHDVFVADVNIALSQPSWVCDGNYGNLKQMIWPRMDTMVWLDYAFPLVMWRVTKRALTNLIHHNTICNGNHDSWRRAFLSKDSVIFWSLTSFHRRRRKYLLLWHSPEFSRVTKVWLHTPQEAEVWLNQQP